MTGFGWTNSPLIRTRRCQAHIWVCTAQVKRGEMTAAGDLLISMNKIEKVFYTDEVETHALSGVDLEIRKGEYVSIDGPSGSGKSTLLAIIGLLDSPSDGQYLFKGEAVKNLDISQRAAIRNREIGFIFQSFNLIGDLTVYENVELPLTYRAMSGSECKQRVQRALERVGMSDRSRHYPSQLSGGQQQRVGVARALAGNPSILLADEPTGNLDSRNANAAELEYEADRRQKSSFAMCLVLRKRWRACRTTGRAEIL
jgi:putative ABC transport system ATP-binding protein